MSDRIELNYFMQAYTIKIYYKYLTYRQYEPEHEVLVIIIT